MPYDLDGQLDRVRAELPITEHCRFFNTGWAGPECRAGIGAQAEMIAWLNTRGISHHSAPRLAALEERVREKVAAAVCASPESIVLTRGVVDGMNLVLNGLTWQPGDHVVGTTIEHAGGIVPLYNLRDRYGVDVTLAPLDDLQDMAAKIDAACTDRTKLILCSHVSYNMGARLPMETIVRAAHARGIKVLVDGAQTAGAIPLDLPASGVDYYALPGHKWMLGPECTGALYLAPGAWEQLAISQPGYASGTYDLRGAYTPGPTVRRFEGIDIDPVAMAGWDAALDFLAGIGDERIARGIASRAARLRQRLSDAAGLRAVTPPAFDDAAGLIGIRLDDDARVKAVATALMKRAFILRWVPLPDMLRVSVNFFNTDEEIDALAAALRETVAAAG